MKNNLSFIQTILFNIKYAENINFNKLQQKQLDIGLQQINNILKYHGKNDEKENETITTFRNEYNNNNNLKCASLQRRLIVDIITILGLPINKLNIQIYGYDSQLQVYQEIFRMTLLWSIKRRQQWIQNLSHEKLIDIIMRLMEVTIPASINTQKIQDLIMNTMPQLMNNYKCYKKNEIFNQKQNLEVIVEFNKEELFINWINMAECGLDEPLFKILLPYYEGAHKMSFKINTFSDEILIMLYNKMNNVIMNKFKK